MTVKFIPQEAFNLSQQKQFYLIIPEKKPKKNILQNPLISFPLTFAAGALGAIALKKLDLNKIQSKIKQLTPENLKNFSQNIQKTIKENGGIGKTIQTIKKEFIEKYGKATTEFIGKCSDKALTIMKEPQKASEAGIKILGNLYKDIQKPEIRKDLIKGGLIAIGVGSGINSTIKFGNALIDKITGKENEFNGISVKEKNSIKKSSESNLLKNLGIAAVGTGLIGILVKKGLIKVASQVKD